MVEIEKSKKIWNLNVDFNFFDMTEEVKEDLYVRNLARYYELDSWLFFPAVPALNHNLDTNYSEWVRIVNKDKEIALWDIHGDFWSYFQQHVYYDNDNEYDIFYAWMEDEGGISLVLVCDSHRVVYGSVGGTFRNALGLPNCGKNYCVSYEQIRFANSFFRKVLKSWTSFPRWRNEEEKFRSIPPKRKSNPQ